MQCVLGGIAPHGRTVQRALDSTLVNGKGILGRTDLRLRVRCGVLRWPLRKVRLASLLPADSYAVICRLEDDRAIVDRATANGGLNQLSMAFANGDDEIGGLSIHYRSQPTPLHNRFFHVFLSRAIRGRVRYRNTRVWLGNYLHRMRLKNIRWKQILFLVIGQREGSKYQNHGQNYAQANKHHS